MSTPRQIVREHILASLEGITVENGYAQNVETVELRNRLARDIHASDCPAIVLTLGVDRPRTETMGGNVGNNNIREWTMDLMLYIRDSGDANTTIQDAGETFLADVERCLIVNRGNKVNTGKPLDIRFEVTSNEFERMENHIAQFNLGIIVTYDFTVGDL